LKDFAQQSFAALGSSADINSVLLVIVTLVKACGENALLVEMVTAPVLAQVAQTAHIQIL